MPDFDSSTIQDDDKVEISDLDVMEDGSRHSLSLVLLKFVRKTPPFTTTRSRTTMLALLTCIMMLLFLVQTGMLARPGKASSSTVLAPSHTVDVRSSFSQSSAFRANEVTWIKISKGKIIEVQARRGVVVWHDCKSRHWHIPRIYMDFRLTIVVCK